jgi:hypothetical protein
LIDRTTFSAPTAVPADRSMLVLQYIVALFAAAAAFVIGLAR